jgi:hypothetical protein
MSGFCARAERGRLIVGAMMGCGVDGSEPNNLEANAARADLARRFVELQEAQSAGWTSRATYVRRIIRALESEVVTRERIGWSLKDWPDTPDELISRESRRHRGNALHNRPNAIRRTQSGALGGQCRQFSAGTTLDE